MSAIIEFLGLLTFAGIVSFAFGWLVTRAEERCEIKPRPTVGDWIEAHRHHWS